MLPCGERTGGRRSDDRCGSLQGCLLYTSEEEYATIKTHTTEGARILKGLAIGQEEPLVKVAHAIWRWHHERWDGGGYPDTLKGDEIPIAAQVVALADAVSYTHLSITMPTARAAT